jgi:Cobalamin-independent synthase, Catalytic domain
VSADFQPLPWPAASATGVGSMPGDDPAEAIAVILGELPQLPHLPELPGRDPGADLTGRTAAMLIDMPVETTPRGWRLAERPGRDQRRAAGLLSADLDAAEQAAEGYRGPFKIQICGPWTLAATLELSRSQEPALADPGAVRDLTASLAEAAARHVAEVRGRLPAATVLLQLDEPALPAVLAGTVPSASGLGRVSPPDAAAAGAGLREVLGAAAAFGIVHCCAPELPFWLIRDAGAGAVGFDLGLLRREDEDAIAEAAEAGLGLLAGAVNTDIQRTAGGESPSPALAASAVTELWRRLGLPSARLAEQVVITPACGLAGLTAAGARAALGCCREAALRAAELIEEGSG